MRFFYTNLIDATGVVISSTSATTNYPASNVAQEFKTKVWRTGTSTAAESITFDLGAAASVTSVILFAHSLLNTDSSIQLRGSTDNFAASDVLVQALTWSSAAINAVFSSASYRYWRVKFTKASSGVTRNIGRIFLGTYFDTGAAYGPDWGGAKFKPADLSTFGQSVGGQIFTDRRQQQRTCSFSFSSLTQSVTDSFKSMSDYIGTSIAFFFVTDPTDTSEASETIYAKLTKPIERNHASVDSTSLWDLSIEAKEQL